MSYKTNNDNIYKEGTFITAKSAPDLKLVITRYFHRTYYCAVVGDTSGKVLTYFERDLLSPAAALNQKNRSQAMTHVRHTPNNRN